MSEREDLAELVERIECALIGTRMSIEGGARSLGILLDTLALNGVTAAILDRGRIRPCDGCKETWLEPDPEKGDFDDDSCDICLEAELDEIESELDDLERRRSKAEDAIYTRKHGK